MKFIKSNQPEFEQSFSSYKCCANGCLLNGPISTSSDKWVCAFHHMAAPEQWVSMTEAIRENKDIIGILDDLLKISEITWNGTSREPSQRDFYQQLFNDRPNLKPLPNENRSKYEYRLKNHIAEVAGLISKKKGPSFQKTKDLSGFYNPAEFF